MGILWFYGVTDLQELKLLGSKIHICTRQELIQKAESALNQRDKSYHFFSLNPIKVIQSQKNKSLRKFIDDADVVYADAVGICVGVKLIHNIKQDRIPGYEFHFDVLKICENSQLKVYIIGSRQRVLEKAIKMYRIKYPNLNLVGYQNGYFDDEKFISKIHPEIQAKSPHLVLVAMGAGLQEKWIEKIRGEIQVPLLMGVGGSMDAFTGVSPRAPIWLCKLGLEWFYRLVMQPKRINAMRPLPVFFYQILKEYITLKLFRRLH